MTKTAPEKLIEINEALIIDNNYLRTELARVREQIAFIADCNKLKDEIARLEGNGVKGDIL